MRPGILLHHHTLQPIVTSEIAYRQALIEKAKLGYSRLLIQMIEDDSRVANLEKIL